jgi:hypothetical protein
MEQEEKVLGEEIHKEVLLDQHIHQRRESILNSLEPEKPFDLVDYWH